MKYKFQTIYFHELYLIICNFLIFVGSALQELSKDKPVMKNVESQTTTFIKTLIEVEKKLTGHINYLTQVSTGTHT